MAYIDYPFYNDIYKGTPIDDPDVFYRLAERASDTVDQLTRNVLHGVEFTQFAELIQTNVKKAVASQVEYLLINGENHGGSPTNVKIGNFSYSGETGNKPVSPAMINYLNAVGLLYRGVSTL